MAKRKGWAGSRAVFLRARLGASQLRTVADRRFDDAVYLHRSGQNARANGAMYLGGFVIECLLKARLLLKHPWLQASRDPAVLSPAQRRLWHLCYRSHDLEGLLGELSDVRARVHSVAELQVYGNLQQICAAWTVFARYSPKSATIAAAGTFLEQIRELKVWLR